MGERQEQAPAGDSEAMCNIFPPRVSEQQTHVHPANSHMHSLKHRHRIDNYLDTLLAMKSEATAIFAPQDGRWKTTVSFDGRRFCIPKFRH